MNLRNYKKTRAVAFGLLTTLLSTAAFAQRGRLELSVTSPRMESDQTIFTKETPFRLKGTAIGIEGIERVTWESVQGFGDAAVIEPSRTVVERSVNWIAGPIGLRPGVNYIRVTALDHSNQVETTAITVFYNPDNAAPPADEIRTSIYQGRTVTYHVKNGLAIYQGDIILGTIEEMEHAGNLGNTGTIGLANGPGKQAATVAATASLWPSVAGVGKVPYFVTAGSGSLTAAINSFNSTFSGVIQFIPHTAEADWVDFNLSPADTSGVCEATVGHAGGGVQTTTGSAACTTSTLLHELGHIVGLWHEQSRRDRNAFVNIINGNVDKPFLAQFDQVFANETDLGLYDYASLMHYFGRQFSKFGLSPTIQSVPVLGIPLSNVVGYSSGDIDAIKRLYGHVPTRITVDTNPSGGHVIVDGINYAAPHTFNFGFGSTHTLDVPPDPQTIGGATLTYIFGVWNDGAGTTRSHSITINPGNGSKFSPATSPAVTVYTANMVSLHEFSTTVSPVSTGTVAVSPQPGYTFNGKKYYYDTQPFTMTATPALGNSFYKWAGVSLFNFYANPYNLFAFTEMAPTIAAFTTNPVTTFASATTNGYLPITGQNPPLVVVVDSIGRPTPFNAAIETVGAGWTAGSTHPVTANTGQTPVTHNIVYNFATWSDGGAQTHTISAPAAGSTNSFTANFTPSYHAIALANPSCGGTIGPNPDTFFADNTSVSYMATANPGMVFLNWTGDLSGTTNPQGFQIHDEFLATANFNAAGTNAPLAVTGFTPASLPSSAGAVDVTVNGTGFSGASIVFWNGTFRLSTFNSSTSITVHLIAGDLAVAGFNRVAVQTTVAACIFQSEGVFGVTQTLTSPTLTVTKSHNGNFTQGETGAQFTILVSNAGGAPTTTSAVTVTEAVPGGLTLKSMSGNGWDCSTLPSCTRADGLLGGTTYPAITVTVDVAGGAGASLTNNVNVSGGGSSNASASDTITVTGPAQMLTITKSHVGSFVLGQNNANYTITVGNAGAIGIGPGTNVTVTETIPAGLTAVSMSGSGWGCTQPAGPCSRNDGLVSGATYPPITVTVNVASGAGASFFNLASVSGGASASANVSDATSTIAAFTDVFPTDFYFDAVNLMRQYSITAGCGVNIYCPGNNVTRAEMAIFIVRAVMGGDTFAFSSTPHFTDVQPLDFGFKWIQKMFELGVTAGCGVNLYCPNDAVTRGQMAIFIIRARLGTAADNTFTFPPAPSFTDVPTNYFAFKWIQRMKLDNITAGCGVGLYCPDDPITRGQMAIFIMRGGFNLLLPAGTPVTTTVTPATGNAGQTVNVTIFGSNTHFAAGTTVNAGPGITVNNVVVQNATSLTAQFVIAVGTPSGPRTILVTSGAEEAILPNGFTIP